VNPAAAADVLLPALAMVALTFVVWIRMYVVRLGAMRRERVSPQQVATSAMAAARLKDTRASDNFRNLFELPVLFYLALVAMGMLGLASPALLGLAWAYVALRVVHSAIHCSSNRVIYRFPVHVASTLVLWLLWLLVALRMPW
jgi:hypothetical protein